MSPDGLGPTIQNRKKLYHSKSVKACSWSHKCLPRRNILFTMIISSWSQLWKITDVSNIHVKLWLFLWFTLRSLQGMTHRVLRRPSLIICHKIANMHNSSTFDTDIGKMTFWYFKIYHRIFSLNSNHYDDLIWSPSLTDEKISRLKGAF